jgi:hypothetical protein
MVQVALLPALGSFRPPSLRRAALVAFWSDIDAAHQVTSLHPIARAEVDRDSTHVTLEPIRSFGTWPGLDDDIPHARRTPSDGEVFVLTLGQLRLSQVIRFLRASRPAERAALDAPGYKWGTAAARPPFVATITNWASGEDAAAYAYGTSSDHNAAISQQRRKDFHSRSAFIRFRVLEQRAPEN